MNKEMQSTLDSLLSGLNRDQLQALLLKLAEQEPSLTATIEKQAIQLQSSSFQPTTPPQQASPRPPIAVDTKAVRRQVRASIHSLDRMRSSEAYWHVGAVVGEIGQLVEQACFSTGVSTSWFPCLRHCSEVFREGLIPYISEE